MTIIYFILILGITVFVHEFGHFLFAKKAGIYVYEFSIGMGPKILKFRRKNDETQYCIGLFPIGGYVQMAGEQVEEDANIPKEKRMQSKNWMQRFLTIIAGVLFNFIFGILILIIIYLISGVPVKDMHIATTTIKNVEIGDKIVKVNGKSVSNYDMLNLRLQMAGEDEFTLTVEHKDGTTDTVETKLQEDKDGNQYYEFQLDGTREKGILLAIGHAFKKFFTTIQQMIFMVL